jgi:hypothetical protein
MFSKKCFVSILCLLMFMTSINATGQTQRQQPKTPQLPVMPDGQKQLETKAHTSRTTTGNLPNVTSTYVSVSMQANWGPFGAAYAPPDTAQLVGVKEAERAVNQTYRFPSIYFNISAAPVIVPIIKDEESPEQISQVMFDDRDMEWMDVSIELEPILAQRQNGVAENDIGGKVVNKKDWEKYVQILEMLPNDTHAALRESLPSKIANVAGEFGSAMVPFVPQIAQSRFTSSTTALGVLFRNIFPPKSVAYRYAFIESSCRFGWYFRQNKGTGEGISLLGLHKGVVLLRVNSEVKQIKVHYSVLSKWNKSPNASSEKYNMTTAEAVALDLPALVEPQIDYDGLQNLNGFPVLIPRAVALKILHLDIAKPEDRKEWDELIGGATPILRSINKGNYITRASLEIFLTMPPTVPAIASPADTNAPATNPPPVKQ